MSGLKQILKWLAISSGALIGAIVLFFLAAGIASDLGMAPATVVQTGEELPPKQLEALKKAKILNPDEKVEFYYSEGLFKITDGGTILSDQRVISYYHHDKQLEVLSRPVNTLDHIEQHEEGDAFTFAEFVVWERGNDDNGLSLFVPHEEGRHMEMFSALENHIAENQKGWATESE